MSRDQTAGADSSTPRRWGRPVTVALLLTLVVALAVRFDPVRAGLAARYFDNLDPNAAPAVQVVDAPPATDRLWAAWGGLPPAQFKVLWTGRLIVLHGGAYTLATFTDNDSRVYLDGQLIVDNGGAHALRRRTGSMILSRGVHDVFIDYTAHGGRIEFVWLWGRDEASLQPVPPWMLASRSVGNARFLASLVLREVLRALEWLWAAALLAFAAGWAGAAPRARLRQEGAWNALRWVIGASIALSLAGIWWGLPVQWVPIELTPPSILDGLAQHFSHGWSDAYPPLHFYVLSLAMSPVIVLAWLARVPIADAELNTLLPMICRLVSVAMAAGVIVAAYRVGAMTFGRRAGIAAAALFAAVAPFLYYAKTANTDVPYIFWWALSMVFYLRALEQSRMRDYVAFAVTATFSVCTKDQAYALFLLPAVVFVGQIWKANRQRGVRLPLARALVDTRLLWPAAIAVVLFALIHNLAFNLTGFRAHVAFLVGSGSQIYRVFEPTLAGRWALFVLTIRLIAESFGWPVLAVCLAGVAIALATPEMRRAAWWLCVPLVSYYVGFINIILYNYDRFVLPMCFVLAVFGGLAVDRLLASRPQLWSWRAAIVGAVFAYTLLYAGAVDVLMIRDSRYEVRDWLAAHVRPEDLIGTAFDQEYLPRLDGFRLQDIADTGQLQVEQPAWFVLNADYARAVPADSALGAVIAGLHDRSLGYRLVHQRRTMAPWPWLPLGHPDLVGPRQNAAVFGILRDVNPTIEVFERITPESPAAER